MQYIRPIGVALTEVVLSNRSLKVGRFVDKSPQIVLHQPATFINGHPIVTARHNAEVGGKERIEGTGHQPFDIEFHESEGLEGLFVGLLRGKQFKRVFCLGRTGFAWLFIEQDGECMFGHDVVVSVVPKVEIHHTAKEPCPGADAVIPMPIQHKTGGFIAKEIERTIVEASGSHSGMLIEGVGRWQRRDDESHIVARLAQEDIGALHQGEGVTIHPFQQFGLGLAIGVEQLLQLETLAASPHTAQVANLAEWMVAQGGREQYALVVESIDNGVEAFIRGRGKAMGVVLVEGFFHLRNRNGIAEVAKENAQIAFRLIAVPVPRFAEQVARNFFFNSLPLCRGTEHDAA